MYKPICKVKQFTKTYSHLKLTLHGVFSYEIVAFFEILLVYMLAALLENDLIIVKTIKYLCSASILCRLRNVLRVSIKFFPYLVRAELVEKNCVISMLLQYYGLDHVLVRKSSGQSFKSSCRGFHEAKCFHVYKPFCKVKQFTKTYSTLKISVAHFLMRSLLFSKPYLYIYLK